MSAAFAYRRAILAASIATYIATFVAFVLLEVPGLGIAHFFYFAIALLALATGPRIGALGGGAATALYAIGVIVNPSIPPRDVLTGSTAIRLVTYTGIGLVIGFFARDNRALVERLQILADRDVLTGLPNTRAFEAAITRRFERREAFALLLVEVDISEGDGNDALRRLADALGSALAPADELARIGGDEFAVLTAAHATEEAARLCVRLESLFAASGLRATFGWAVYPQEGDNALALYRAADERLYARKLIRGRGGQKTVPLAARMGLA